MTWAILVKSKHGLGLKANNENMWIKQIHNVNYDMSGVSVWVLKIRILVDIDKWYVNFIDFLEDMSLVILPVIINKKNSCCILCLGRRKVSESLSQVPWPHLRMHNGLVHPMAKRCPNSCLQPLCVKVWNCLSREHKTAACTDNGRISWWCCRDLLGILSEVIPF